jgi:hypothetical protein
VSPEESSDDETLLVCNWCQSLEPCFPTLDSTETSAESTTTRKRKRDDLTEDDVLVSLRNWNRTIAVQRHLALSYIDDVTLSLNLHQLEPRPSTMLRNTRFAQTVEARQGLTAHGYVTDAR